MNEDCLILLYSALSYETLRSGEPVVALIPGQFAGMAKYPGLKVRPMVRAAAERLFLLTVMNMK